MSSYSSKAATFSAANNVSHQRRVTGLDGPSAAVIFGQSFPQPDDINQVEGDESITNNSPASEHKIRKENQVSYEKNEMQESTASVRSTSSVASGLDDNRLANLVRGQDSSSSNTKRRKESDLSRQNQLSPKRGRASSFVTAPEIKASKKLDADNDQSRDIPGPVTINIAGEEPHIHDGEQSQLESRTASSIAQRSETHGDIAGSGDGAGSTSSLLPSVNKSLLGGTLPVPQAKNQPLHEEAPEVADDAFNVNQTPRKKRNPISSVLVRFKLPNEAANGVAQVNAKLVQATHGRSLRQLRRSKSKPGEIVKMEKMLVRIDSTMQQLPDDYDENDSLKTESRMVEKWREFIVVCRASTDESTEYVIQMYKTRVIQAVEQTHVQQRSAYDIPLKRKSTKVNLYSSLDKTVVIWVPWKKGTRIYILRPQSLASSVEWYTFIHSFLGWQRSRSLQISIPDLSVSLHLENPFEQLEASCDAAQAAEGNEAAIARTIATEKAIAGSIVRRCMDMLQDSPEWADVLEAWLRNEKMGLAWKRYDRLEWVHGANEQKMYGTLAMQRSHDLELRPKQHYPTDVRTIGLEPMEEPPPVEGFLIRLTSQRGREQRLGKMFFKRLYFATHNQFLCFCRPAKAVPPPPPKLIMDATAKMLSTSQIMEKTPLIFAVNPYPMEDGRLAWLLEKSATKKRKHDESAQHESERQVTTLLQAEGYINLSHVTKVRHIWRGSTPVDQDMEEGSDVDFHFDEENNATRQDDGSTKSFDDDRTFELVLRNGLVIRLQAFSKVTKKEWMTRLRRIVKYWKIRIAEDQDISKMIRQSNLRRLKIDEEMESFLGQYARKWEVRRSEASPQLFNMCGIACCRTITVRTLNLDGTRLADICLDVRRFVPKTTSSFDIPPLWSDTLSCTTTNLRRYTS